jgi:trimethylamine--corrinoid protein Co-methyltransferase
MDMRSGAAVCGGPEDIVFQMANAQLARAYGFKSMVGTFASGSRTSDWQAGAENSASGFASWVAGVDMFSGAGLLYAARVFSHAQLVLDAELFDMIASTSEGVGDPQEIDYAVEQINEVGPGNHFLDQEYTLEHMYDVWPTEMFSHASWEDWEAAGRPIPKTRPPRRPSI